MKKSLLVAVLVVTCQFNFAMGEKDTTRVNSKARYFFHVQAGPLVSTNGQQSSPMTFATSMVHGIKVHDRYNLGLGVGVDYYETRRVVPLFVSIAADLVGQKNNLFLEVNYGGSHSKPLIETYGLSKSKPGYFINPNIGYSIKVQKLAVSFIAGYRFQRMTDYYTYPSYYLNDFALSGENTTIIQMDLSRLVLGIRVGLR